jgi:hypothetical protein
MDRTESNKKYREKANLSLITVNRSVKHLLKVHFPAMSYCKAIELLLSNYKTLK